jgi:hypothetical protein
MGFLGQMAGIGGEIATGGLSGGMGSIFGGGGANSSSSN